MCHTVCVRSAGWFCYTRYLHRAIADMRRQATCDSSTARKCRSSDADVVPWAESCYTMRPNEHMSVFRLLHVQRCLQVAPAVTESDDQGAASDNRGAGPEGGTQVCAT